MGQDGVELTPTWHVRTQKKQLVREETRRQALRELIAIRPCVRRAFPSGRERQSEIANGNDELGRACVTE